MSKEEKLRALAKRISEKKPSEEDLNSLLNFMEDGKHKVFDIYPCSMGICIDMDIDVEVKDLKLEDFVDKIPGEIKEIQIFPIGIIAPQISRLKISHEL